MSGSVLAELAAPLAAAVAGVGGDGASLRLERPSDPQHGDYASGVAMALAKPLRSAPRDIAGQIVERLESPWLTGAEIAGPGFINLRVTPSWLGHVVGRVLDEGERYGAGAAAKPQRVQVEYVSANPVGPLTVGSARNAAYGDALSRLFAFAGHEVSREYYFNDAGRQIDLFGASLAARARGEEPPEDGYQGAYVAEVAASLGLPPDAPDEEWSRLGTAAMMAEIRTTLERFRVEFDSWFRERSLYEDGSVERTIERLKTSGHTYEQDGALWFRSTDFGDDKDRVILRSNGKPSYFAGDLAYIVSKLERGFDTAVYVLGADHHGYAPRLKGAGAALGYEPDRVDVQIYQLIHLKGGRMSKRSGLLVTLDDLLDQIGTDAARLALVQRSHDQTIDLDLDLLVSQNAGEPGLLQPVRARPHRRHPAQGRRRRGRCAPAARLGAGRGGACTGQAARRLPRPGGRGRRAARPAPGRRLRAGHGPRVPPLLHGVPGAPGRARAAGEPAGAVRGDPPGGRHRPRPDRGRGARHHVGGSACVQQAAGGLDRPDPDRAQVVVERVGPGREHRRRPARAGRST